MGRAARAIVPALYLVVALATFRGYGITWDESVQSRYGELALRYYTTLGADTSADRFLNLRFYGPLFEMIPAAIYSMTPFAWKYDVRHLCIALTGFLALLGVGAFCARAGVRPWVGQLALLFLPQFYGHSFNNSKDIPFACAVVWTMTAMARLLDEERFSRKWTLLAGLALGCSLAIRVGALLFVAIVFLVLVVERRWRALPSFAAACAIGWIVMVLAWPWAQHAPVANPITAFGEAVSFPISYPVFFEGRVWQSSALPARYLTELLTLTTPPLMIAFVITGLCAAIKRHTTHAVLAMAWFVIPIVLFVLTKPNVYDGIRHFLFLLPAMAILAALALEEVRWMHPAVLVLPVVAMLRLHPYEMTYFNSLAGGTAVAQQRYETDYWASSYREAALWLSAHATQRPARVLVAGTSYSVECLRWYLPRDRFVVVRTMDTQLRGRLPLDWYVGTTRYGLSGNFPDAPVAAMIGRDGAVFTVIRKGR